MTAVREYFRDYERKVWVPGDLQDFPYMKVFFGVLGFRVPQECETIAFSKLLIKTTASRSRSVLYDAANLALHATQDRDEMAHIVESREQRFDEIRVAASHFRARYDLYINAVRSGDALLVTDFINAWEKGIDPPDANN